MLPGAKPGQGDTVPGTNKVGHGPTAKQRKCCDLGSDCVWQLAGIKPTLVSWATALLDCPAGQLRQFGPSSST